MDIEKELDENDTKLIAQALRVLHGTKELVMYHFKCHEWEDYEFFDLTGETFYRELVEGKMLIKFTTGEEGVIEWEDFTFEQIDPEEKQAHGFMALLIEEISFNNFYIGVFSIDREVTLAGNHDT